MKKTIITIILIFTSIINLQAKKTKHKEITEKEREKAALMALKSSPQTVQVYAKGLVCPSCAIGVRKKVKSLKFVDTNQAKKGIVLDVKNQLISISVKKGKFIDIFALSKAIKKAGYEPVTMYELDNKRKLKSVSLVTKR